MAIGKSAVCFALLLALASARTQLLDAQATKEYGANANAADVIYGLETDSASSWTSTFAFMGWVKMNALPAESITVLALESGTRRNLVSISKTVTGTVVVDLPLSNGSMVQKTISGKADLNWEHLAVMTCQAANGVWTLSVCSSGWKETPKCQSFDLESAPAPYDSTISAAYIGGYGGKTIEGLIVDIQLETNSCVDVGFLKVIVMGAECGSACWGECYGPGHLACSDFVQLIPVAPATQQREEPYHLTMNDPLLKGFSLSSTDVAITGWWYQTEKPPFSHLARIQVRNDNFGKGARTLSLFTSTTNLFHVAMDTDQKDNSSNNLQLAKDIRNQWVFYAASICHDKDGTSVVCSGHYGDDTVQCKTKKLEGTPFKWGDGNYNGLYIGKDKWHSYSGKFIDNRVYNRCLDETEMAKIFKDKASYCVPGCGNCETPEKCGGCAAGYYSE